MVALSDLNVQQEIQLTDEVRGAGRAQGLVRVQVKIISVWHPARRGRHVSLDVRRTALRVGNGRATHGCRTKVESFFNRGHFWCFTV